MTRNQLAYWELQENKRSHLANEGETHRANLARETETMRANQAQEAEAHRANIARETETQRANLAREAQAALDSDRSYTISTQTLAETIRRDDMQQALGYDQLAETTRSHMVNEALTSAGLALNRAQLNETIRANREREKENYRSNLIDEKLRLYNLEEAQRHNKQVENQTTLQNALQAKNVSQTQTHYESGDQTNIWRLNETIKHDRLTEVNDFFSTLSRTLMQMSQTAKSIPLQGGNS